MIKQELTIKTRPFQPLLLASEDLLKLAKPYYDQIQEHKLEYDSSGNFEPLPDGVWQIEKSLSIAAFMTKYAGMEAFLNSCLNDFSKKNPEELSDNYFVGPLSSIKKKIKKSNPKNWRLDTRLFLSIPICSEPEIDPTSIFNIESNEWKEFEEVIEIRHSFAHANSVDIKQVATKVGPKEWIADDSHPDNFWPLTKTPKDHRILNYESAKNLNRIIEWAISNCKHALKNLIDENYGSQEMATIENGDNLSLGRPNYAITKKIIKTVSLDKPKQKRNDKCACGSGKKFKKCCGA